MNTIQTFTNRVLNGDCLSVMPQLPSESIDLVFTDPPYLVGYRDRQGRSLANDENAKWLAPAFAEVFRVLKPGRFCATFYGWPKADTFMRAWRAAGFRPVAHLSFVKAYASKSRFVLGMHETAYLLCKGEGRKPDVALPDVLPWFNTSNRLHRTQKPVPSLKPVIESLTHPGEIVLDPFCGAGSTLLAAKILGRRYIGIELDASFCETARNRLSESG
jgi:adenine-specific DNA-methyltransferase